MTHHFHSLVLGGFCLGISHSRGDFVALRPPETDDVARVPADTVRRILGVLEWDEIDGHDDSLAGDARVGLDPSEDRDGLRSGRVDDSISIAAPANLAALEMSGDLTIEASLRPRPPGRIEFFRFVGTGIASG